jgi:hypothetical protein
VPIGLLQAAGLHGRMHAVEAALAAAALRQSGLVTVSTSDEDGMRELCADRWSSSRSEPITDRSPAHPVNAPPNHRTRRLIRLSRDLPGVSSPRMLRVLQRYSF